jgi:transcriptional regulator with XRE-family HTH domain
MAYVIPDDEMLIAEDALITHVQFAIHNLLEKKHVSRRELSLRMGVSESHISQIFRDNSRNLTLKTIARIFRALDEEPRITSELLSEILPPPKKREGGVGEKPKKRVDWIALILSETKCMSEDFRSECNDNEIGANLVA